MASSPTPDSPDAAGKSPDAAGKSPDAAGDSPKGGRDSPDAARDSPDAARDSPDAAGEDPDAEPDSPGAAGEDPDAEPDSPGAAGEDPDAAARTPAAAGHPHRILVRVLLGLATLLGIFAIFAVWANRQLLNPNNWARTSTALLAKPTIRSSLSTYLVDQLYANINVTEELKSRLPTNLRPLAGPVAGALHNAAEQAAEKALETPTVQTAWEKANRAADEALVTIVNGGGRHVQINGGTVSLNLRQIVADLTERLGLPASLAGKLPASVANLKVVTSSQLGLVRNLAKALHALALLLTILVVAMYALAVYLARGYRRRTLMWVGWGFVFAGLVAILGVKIGQGQLVSAITNDASIEPAANDAYSVATSLLVQVASAVIIIGVPLILAAWLAGPTRPAIAVRRFLAPYLRERPALAYWGAAVLIILIFIWGPIPATRNPWEMLLFTILAFAGAHVLREQIAKEFPDAESVSLREYYARTRQTMHGERHAAAAATEPAEASTAGDLERLSALHERGALTDDEYAAAKRELLSVS